MNIVYGRVFVAWLRKSILFQLLHMDEILD